MVLNDFAFADDADFFAIKEKRAAGTALRQGAITIEFHGQYRRRRRRRRSRPDGSVYRLDNFRVGINGRRKRGGDKDVASGGLVLGSFGGSELFENFAKILGVDGSVGGWIEVRTRLGSGTVAKIEKPDQRGKNDER